MPEDRVLCLLCALLINFISANPTQTVAGKYVDGHPQQDLSTILSSIDTHLKNLDSLYTTQLTPTLEMRLEQYQNRLGGIETKLLRVEALITTKLDRIADNISSRHFRDDIVQTDLFRKIETAYDGVNHRLAYMDRKLETNFLKIQSKADVIWNKLEKMDDTLTAREDDIETELADSIAAIDDLSTLCKDMHKSILNASETNLNKSRKEQEKLMEAYEQSITQALIAMHSNRTEELELLKHDLNLQLGISNNSEQLIATLGSKFEETMNDYANKVADMHDDVWKSNSKMFDTLEVLGSVTNFTKSDIQNGIRALMVQVGKISPKEKDLNDAADVQGLGELKDSMKTNFAKIISTQDLFLESCYRLQMDESQIETKISDVLEKLIDTIGKTTREQMDEMKRIDSLLSRHDGIVKRELHQANTNIKNLFDKTVKEVKKFDYQVTTITTSLEAVFAMVQNMMADQNSQNETDIKRYMKTIDNKMNIIKTRQINMTASMKTMLSFLENKTEHVSNHVIYNTEIDIDRKINLLPQSESNMSREIKDYIEKTYDFVNQLNNKINNIKDVQMSDSSNNVPPKNTGRKYNSSIDTKKINSTLSEEELDKIINEIFNVSHGNLGQKTSLNTTNKRIDDNSTIIPEVDCLDFDIDVRSNFKKCKQPKNITIEDNIRIPDTNVKNVSADNQTENNCLDIDIDVRFGNNETNLFKICQNSSEIVSSKSTPTPKLNAVQDECLEHDSGPKRCKNISNTDSKPTSEGLSKHTENGDIYQQQIEINHDLQSSSETTPIDNQEDCLEYDIDIRFDPNATDGFKKCKNTTTNVSSNKNKTNNDRVYQKLIGINQVL